MASNIAFSQSLANYNISLTTIWNTTDHSSLPSNAHWSPLAGATHKNLNDILVFGATAPMTNGIKDIAETGNTTNFNNEINDIITAGNADQYLQQGFSPFAGNNSNATINNVTVSENFPLITLVSMVAPSPDWFIAVNNLDLRSGNDPDFNGWEKTFTIDVFAYDAGTDDGTDYGSGNSASSPRQPISMITGFPINGNKMGTITFTLNTSTLSTNQIDTLENIKLYPNPTNGQISISNIKNNELNAIEIFNVLGRLVKERSIKSGFTKVTMDLTSLNKGIYLVQIKAIDGASKTQKLVIK
ncbi:hypothetical protein GCM10023314_31470 [Algibacter agarivorans]|uniref:Spondin domain-containing protein n=1 Tax=Algibacter agarivorans TaxID=1109741 RepID=A0ABP9GXD2_9FLAO